MTSTDLPSPVQRATDEFLVSQRHRELLVAASGGADSTALLLALVRGRTAAGPDLAVAHFQHGLRPDASADREFVTGLCRRLGVRLTVASAAPGELAAEARRDHASLEDTARVHRHRFLRAAAGTGRMIVLGHTLSDQLETLIMRFFQGAGPRGLIGMRKVSGRLARPLLSCTREDVIAYLRSIGEGWREDPSNRDLRFLRNRVRAELLPALREVFPGLDSSLPALSRKMVGWVEVVDRTLAAGPVWREGRHKAGCSVPAEEFLGLPSALRTESILGAIDTVLRRSGARSGLRIPHAFVQAAASDGWGVREGSLLQGHGVVVERKKGLLTVRPCVVSNVKTGYLLYLGGPQQRVVESDRWKIRMGEVREGKAESRLSAVVAGGAVDPPLILRTRRPGDRIVATGGSKPVNQLFAEWGIRAGDRSRIPLLCDRMGVAVVYAASAGGQNRVRHGLDSPAHGGPLYRISISQRS